VEKVEMMKKGMVFWKVPMGIVEELRSFYVRVKIVISANWKNQKNCAKIIF
jgi:hypothetical protein